ncbi:Amino acid ABC transporter, periplasmic amino acid-binding protein [Pseudomonas syringae pv. delphinii]|uniref:Amino acid ABC transporter, periplasmic amino acid-binding protein n=1 Tax=Pseudomonas syringae pv. delphinii TaxID=192088 RepID=A0A0P9PQF3_9PSED|nr:transporter substrate-binding domain-containing protein [Pseudomonas syringae group genomosp. 3]KPX20602.1 Amino acid ABC transporter, periplasmic amino acid-binding protein [Pseudomonas syringae pv. delphinii]RMP17449.1 Amino acid ABC transporter, periplasmic amino acid-binding protein [Pseudomonas syringae pv. delphinii]RMP20874.1 Amino acid ABC transporter, periplasmic amino acid-binding protein [Pseudomonas syringae pv. delphinii]RMQ19771.1 Amino acid ABC transporter, periplasmic amino a
MKKAWLTLSALALCIAAGNTMAKEYKELRFGVDPSYAPFESKAANGSLVGFDIDLGNAICKELKVTCKWVESDFDGMIPGLKARKFDGVISSMTVTPAREKVIDFSNELFSGPTSLVFKKGAGFTADPASLKGKTVGYEQGTIQEAYAKAVLDKSGVTTKAYANQDQVYADLTSGRLDASIQDMLQAELGFLKSPAGADYEVSKPIDSELLPAKTAIGIAQGNKELKALLDKGIKAMHDDGTYAEIQKKHFGDLNLYSGK